MIASPASSTMRWNNSAPPCSAMTASCPDLPAPAGSILRPCAERVHAADARFVPYPLSLPRAACSNPPTSAGGRGNEGEHELRRRAEPGGQAGEAGGGAGLRLDYDRRDVA